MFLYTVSEAVFAVIAGIAIAVRAKKLDHVTYGKLDKAGRITNILLIPIYVCFSPVYLFLGMISSPAYTGILGILGWMVSVLIASATLFCGLGLGLSVALRKKGERKLSFAVQFLGLAAIGASILLYSIFEGNLLKSLN